jgi:hypothetical protein
LVTAVAEGTATITVTTEDGGYTATCAVTVSAGVTEPKGITMTTSKNYIMLQIAGSGTISIDWGDGTSTHTLSTTEWTYCYRTYAGLSAHTITIIGEDITSLACHDNQLTALDVSNNTALTWFYCYDNQLTLLNVSNTALTELYCHANQLTELDVSNNPALTWLDCSSNQLTNLDVSVCTALTYLQCSANQLTAEALNALFGTLHSNSVEEEKRLYIIGNPGTADCDLTIAKGKGWTVDYFVPISAEELFGTWTVTEDVDLNGWYNGQTYEITISGVPGEDGKVRIDGFAPYVHSNGHTIYATVEGGYLTLPSQELTPTWHSSYITTVDPTYNPNGSFNVPIIENTDGKLEIRLDYYEEWSYDINGRDPNTMEYLGYFGRSKNTVWVKTGQSGSSPSPKPQHVLRTPNLQKGIKNKKVK